MRTVILFFPELLLLGTAFAGVLFSFLFRNRLSRSSLVIAIGSLSVVAFVVGGVATAINILVEPQRLVSETVLFDPFSQMMKMTILFLGGFGAFVSLVGIRKVERGETFQERYYLESTLLNQIAAVFSMVAVSGTSLLFVALTFAMFVILGSSTILIEKQDRSALEAATKYFYVHAVGVVLFSLGVILVLGICQSEQFPVILRAIQNLHGEPSRSALELWSMVFLLLAGLVAFLGLVPFSSILPDITQGSSTGQVVNLVFFQRAVALAWLFRLGQSLFDGVVPSGAWREVLLGVSLCTVLWGSLGAVGQRNIKRVLGYFLGFKLGALGVAISLKNPEAAQAAWFSFIFDSVSFLGLAQVLDRLMVGKQEEFTLERFERLAKSSPLWCALVAFFLLYFVGLFPSPNFFGFLGVIFVAFEEKAYFSVCTLFISWVIVFWAAGKLAIAPFTKTVEEGLVDDGLFQGSANTFVIKRNSVALCIAFALGFFLVIAPIFSQNLFRLLGKAMPTIFW